MIRVYRWRLNIAISLILRRLFHFVLIRVEEFALLETITTMKRMLNYRVY